MGFVKERLRKQLAPILAPENTNPCNLDAYRDFRREGGTSSSQAGVWTTGPNGRVIFFWDEGVFRNTSISTTYINTDQEKYLHNIMAYALDKVGL